METKYRPVTIQIKTEQWESGKGHQTIRVSCPGRLYPRPDGNVILYKESGEDALQGTLTKLTLNSDGSVRLTRTGLYGMNVLLQSGRREITKFTTPHGVMSFGMFVNSVQQFELEDGGSAKLSYSLDYGNDTFLNNRMDIRYRFTEVDLTENGL